MNKAYLIAITVLSLGIMSCGSDKEYDTFEISKPQFTEGISVQNTNSLESRLNLRPEDIEKISKMSFSMECSTPHGGLVNYKNSVHPTASLSLFSFLPPQFFTPQSALAFQTTCNFILVVSNTNESTHEFHYNNLNFLINPQQSSFPAYKGLNNSIQTLATVNDDNFRQVFFHLPSEAKTQKLFCESYEVEAPVLARSTYISDFNFNLAKTHKGQTTKAVENCRVFAYDNNLLIGFSQMFQLVQQSSQLEFRQATLKTDQTKSVMENHYKLGSYRFRNPNRFNIYLPVTSWETHINRYLDSYAYDALTHQQKGKLILQPFNALAVKKHQGEDFYEIPPDAELQFDLIAYTQACRLNSNGNKLAPETLEINPLQLESEVKLYQFKNNNKISIGKAKLTMFPKYYIFRDLTAQRKLGALKNMPHKNLDCLP